MLKGVKNSGQGESLMKKKNNRGKKSHETAPLTNKCVNASEELDQLPA
jgi:hypothetical protein